MASREEQAELFAAIMNKMRPERIRATLGFAGLYQIVHAQLQDLVVDRVRGFYTMSMPQDTHPRGHQSYRDKVLALDPKSRFHASLLWLVESKAISQEQADRIEQIHEHRNVLTHELLRLFVDTDPDFSLLADAIRIMRDLYRFWAQIEIDIGSFEHLGDNITVDDVAPAWGFVIWVALATYRDGVEGDLSPPAADKLNQAVAELESIIASELRRGAPGPET